MSCSVNYSILHIVFGSYRLKVSEVRYLVLSTILFETLCLEVTD